MSRPNDAAPRPPSRIHRLMLLIGFAAAAACREEPPLQVAADDPPAATAAALGAAGELPFDPAAPGAVGPFPAAPHWVLVGGGADPFSTELQIETDAVAAEAFLKGRLGPGIPLFAGGAGAFGVRVERADAGAEDGLPLEAVLAEIFGATYTDAPYRPHRVPALGPADADTVHAALAEAVAPSGPPLVVWLQGHGEPAADADDGAFALWGGAVLTPGGLRDSVGPSPARDVRVVASLCHAGGFTSLGAAPAPDGRAICVLAATTWDRVASGCDADPERRAHDSYGRHLVAALTDGGSADSDGDGVVNWLEAHGAAAVASRGFDVPVTTSMRIAMAAAASSDTPPEPSAVGQGVPEFDAAVAGLAKRLAVEVGPGLEALVAARLRDFDAARTEAREAAEEAAARHDVEAARLRGALLSRWPVLDDPGHPRFAPTLATHGRAIADDLRTSEYLAAWRTAQDAWSTKMERVDAAELAIAPWLRLDAYLRAARGAKLLLAREPRDEGRAHLEALLRCERGL